MVNGCLPNWHLWVADKEARGPADIWGNGPLAASSPGPLVAVTRMCGLLCMCTTALGTPQRGQTRRRAVKPSGRRTARRTRRVDSKLTARPRATRPQRFGDSRLGESILAVWQALTDSIPIPPTSVYSAQSMFLGRPISGVPKPLCDDVCWAYGLPLPAPRIGGGSLVRNSAPCSWQAFSRALSHAGLMPGARADPWVGPRL